MPREDVHLPKRETWRTLFALAGVTAVLSGLAFWGAQMLTDRQARGLERTLASLAAEKAVLEQQWSSAQLAAETLGAEEDHIDEEASTASQELEDLSQVSSHG